MTRCLEVCNHGIDMYKSLLRKPALRFNSSLLLQPHFDSLMEQILVKFSKQVNLKGVKAWDIMLRNINVIHRMYGVTNSQRRRGLLGTNLHWLPDYILIGGNLVSSHALKGIWNV